MGVLEITRECDYSGEVTSRGQGPKEPPEERNPSMNELLAVTEPRYILYN